MNTISPSEAIKAIESSTSQAAEAVRPCLNNANLESYQRFLNYMYHYTLKSGDKLAIAAKNAPNPELKDFFEHMFREERAHYVLAEQDLKGFGLKPDSKTPQAIVEFNQFWDNLSKGHFNGYLGALYVFENIADKVGAEVKNLLSRLNITEKQKRWLNIHMEADVEHGQAITDLLKKYLADDVDSALKAAQEAQKRWSAVMVGAFEN
jgi:hypothetical protein